MSILSLSLSWNKESKQRKFKKGTITARSFRCSLIKLLYYCGFCICISCLFFWSSLYGKVQSILQFDKHIYYRLSTFKPVITDYLPAKPGKNWNDVLKVEPNFTKPTFSVYLFYRKVCYFLCLETKKVPQRKFKKGTITARSFRCSLIKL